MLWVGPKDQEKSTNYVNYFFQSLSLSGLNSFVFLAEFSVSVSISRGKTCISNAQSVKTNLFLQNSWKNTWQHMKGPKNIPNSYPHLPEITNWKNVTSVTMLQIWINIWFNMGLGEEKDPTNVINVVTHPIKQTIWRNIWRYTVKKGHTNVINAALAQANILV